MNKTILTILISTILTATTFSTANAEDNFILPEAGEARYEFNTWRPIGAGVACVLDGAYNPAANDVTTETHEHTLSNNMSSATTLGEATTLVNTTPCLYPFSSVDNTLVWSFVHNGFSYEKSIGLAYAYTCMCNMKRCDGTDYIPEHVRQAILCQIAKEGCPGLFEQNLPGTLSAEHWLSVPEAQRVLAGTTLCNIDTYVLGYTIPASAQIGCGMLQWTGSRRAELFSTYALLCNSNYTLETTAYAESVFLCSEFLKPYYARILPWCEGRDVDDTVRVITVYYVGQTSQYEIDARKAFLPYIQQALNTYTTLQCA